MTRRVVFAAISLGIVLLGFNAPGFGLLLLLCSMLLGFGCLWELKRIVALRGAKFPYGLIALGSLLLTIDAVANEMRLLVPGLGALFAAGCLSRLRGETEGAGRDLAATGLALLYIVVPFAVFAGLFQLGWPARAWILFTFAIIWATDSGALFVGKALGKTKLCPRISPGKTVEGFLGGLGAGLVVAIIVRAFFNGHFETVGDLHLLLFALMVSVLGQLGDLLESMIKRDVGLKDSGSQLTGHGGFLDLMDAVMFIMLPLYCYLAVLQPQVLAPS